MSKLGNAFEAILDENREVAGGLYISDNPSDIDKDRETYCFRFINKKNPEGKPRAVGASLQRSA